MFSFLSVLITLCHFDINVSLPSSSLTLYNMWSYLNIGRLDSQFCSTIVFKLGWRSCSNPNNDHRNTWNYQRTNKKWMHGTVATWMTVYMVRQKGSCVRNEEQFLSQVHGCRDIECKGHWIKEALQFRCPMHPFFFIALKSMMTFLMKTFVPKIVQPQSCHGNSTVSQLQEQISGWNHQ